MSRKNLLEISSPNGERPEPAPHRDSRPLAGLAPTVRSGSPVGGITKTLGNITEKMERATDLERQLAQGQTIVEIDPGLVDASFVADRLEIDPVELAQLVEQIREHGHQVPVLLRPHPEAKSRYQVAYGHLAAAYAVLTENADCCLATRSAAQTFGLGFVPLRSERYDLVMRKRTLEFPAAQMFIEVLQRAALRRKLEVLAGYDTTQTGSILA